MVDVVVILAACLQRHPLYCWSQQVNVAAAELERTHNNKRDHVTPQKVFGWGLK